MRKKGTGSSLLASLLLLLLPGPGTSGERPRRGPEPYGLIAGTVFRDPGFAQPGAEVTLSAASGSSNFKAMKAVSDRRGEFAFRVPPRPGEYRVSVKLKGFEPERKDVTIAGEERVDLTFNLKPAGR